MIGSRSSGGSSKRRDGRLRKRLTRSLGLGHVGSGQFVLEGNLKSKKEIRKLSSSRLFCRLSPWLHGLALAVAANASIHRHRLFQNTKLLCFCFFKRPRSTAVFLFAHKAREKLLVLVCKKATKQYP